jgi:PilZ domain
MNQGADKRASPRRRVLKTAYIVISKKAPKLECAARNISSTGACLHVSTTVGIPDTFRAVIEGVQRSCRTIWKTDNRLGVRFE